MKGKSGEVFESGDGMGGDYVVCIGVCCFGCGEGEFKRFLLTGVFMFFTVRFV